MNSSFKYLSGFSKICIDIRLFLRVVILSLTHFGITKGIKELNQYFKNKANLFNTKVNRYVKIGKLIYAAPDLPPVNSTDFIKSVLKDITYINHKINPGFLFVIFCISSRCPYKCNYCYNSDMHSDKESLSLEQIITTIYQLKSMEVKNIYLSGGEPMTRYDDILIILNEFKDSNINFWLLTTGWQMTENKISDLKKLGLKGIMVSFDSYEQEYIHSVKKNKSSYDLALNTIKWSSQYGLITVIDCVLNKTLLDQEKFNKLIHKISEAGGQFINCYTPKNIKNKISDPDMMFNISDFNLLGKLIDANHKEKKNVPVAYSPDLWESVRGCTGGKLFMYIDPSGNIRKCPFSEEIFGNISTNDLKNIISKINNDKKPNLCQTVEYLQKYYLKDH
ncbi:MAG: radical SAM protein [Marinilabiliales bacterium]